MQEATLRLLTEYETGQMELMTEILPVTPEIENRQTPSSTSLEKSKGSGDDREKTATTIEGRHMLEFGNSMEPFDIKGVQERRAHIRGGGGGKSPKSNNKAEPERSSCESYPGQYCCMPSRYCSCRLRETTAETPCGPKPSEKPTQPEPITNAEEKKEKPENKTMDAGFPAGEDGETGTTTTALSEKTQTTTTIANQEDDEKTEVPLTREEALARMKAAGMDVDFSPLPIFFGAASLKQWHEAARERRKKSQANQGKKEEEEEEEETSIMLLRKGPIMAAPGSGLVAEDLCNPSTRGYITPEITPKTPAEWMALWREAFDDLKDRCTDPEQACDAYGRRAAIEKAFMAKEETETFAIPWYRDPKAEPGVLESYAAFCYANNKYAIARRVVVTDEVNEIDKRNAEEQERHEHFTLMHVCTRDVENAVTKEQCTELAARLEKHVLAFETAKKHDKQAEMYKLLRKCKDKLEAKEKETKHEEGVPETLVNNETKIASAVSTTTVAEQFDRSLKGKGNKKKKKQQDEIKRCTHAIWKASFPIKDGGRDLPLEEVFPAVTQMIRSKMKVDMQHAPPVETRDVTPPKQETKGKEEEEEEEEQPKVYRVIHQFDRIPEEKVVGHLLTTNAESKISPWRATGLKVVLPATFNGTEQELVVASHEQVRIFDMPFCKEKEETYYIVPEQTVKTKKRIIDPSHTLFKTVHPCISEAYVLLFGYFEGTDVPVLLCIDRRAKIMTVMLSDVPISCVILSSTQPNTALVGLHNGVVLRVDLSPVVSTTAKKKKTRKLRQELMLYLLSDKTLPENYQPELDYYSQFCPTINVVPPYTDPDQRGTRNTFFAGNVVPVLRIVERGLRVLAMTRDGIDMYRMMDEWKDENVVTLGKRNVATFAFMGNLLVALMYDNSVGMMDLVRGVMDRIDGPPIALKPAPPPTAQNVEAVVVQETSVVVFHKDTTRRIISLTNAASGALNLHELAKPKTQKERAQSFLADTTIRKNSKKKKNKKGKK
jgi:hypothetical protein